MLLACYYCASSGVIVLVALPKVFKPKLNKTLSTSVIYSPMYPPFLKNVYECGYYKGLLTLNEILLKNTLYSCIISGLVLSITYTIIGIF